MSKPATKFNTAKELTKEETKTLYLKGIEEHVANGLSLEDAKDEAFFDIVLRKPEK